MVFPEMLKVTVIAGENQQNICLITRVCNDFEKLQAAVLERFPGLKDLQEIKFFWIDAENDEISIYKNEDFLMYLEIVNTSGASPRIYVKGGGKKGNSIAAASTDLKKEAADNLPIHVNVVCDVCDQVIIGHRYKCLMCYNYDICMRCETKLRHKDHLMLRIPTATSLSAMNDAIVLSKLYPSSAAAEKECSGDRKSKRKHSGKSREEKEEKSKERRHRKEKCGKDEEYSKYSRCGKKFAHAFGYSANINGNMNIDPSTMHEEAHAKAHAAATAAVNAALNNPLNGEDGQPQYININVNTPQTGDGQPEQRYQYSGPINGNGFANINIPASVAAAIPMPWYIPTSEHIQRINQTFSKILDPLGMNIEVKTTAQKKDERPAQTQTEAGVKKDQTTETPKRSTASTPSQTPSIPNTFSFVSSTSAASNVEVAEDVAKKMNDLQASVRSNLISTQENLEKTRKTLENLHIPDYSQEAKEEHEDTNVEIIDSPSSESSMSEEDEIPTDEGKKWTLIDLPEDNSDVEYTPKNTGAIPKTPEKKTAVVQLEKDSVASTPSVSGSAPLNFEQLGQALKYHIDEMTRMGMQANKAGPSSASETPKTPVMQAPITPTPAPVTVVDAVNPSIASIATPVVVPPPANVPAPVFQPAVPVFTPAQPGIIQYHKKPHIDHAIHTMLSMGFSNEGGWLTQLLESVDGNIPRALDLLQPHK